MSISTSTKTPASIRHGGPVASQKNAKDAAKIETAPGDEEITEADAENRPSS